MTRPGRLLAAFGATVLLGAFGCGGGSEQERLAGRINEQLDEAEQQGQAAVAQNREAQSSARNALTAAKTLYTDTESYVDLSIDELAESEPSLEFTEGASSGPDIVSISAEGEHQLHVAVLSESGTCFAIRDVAFGADDELGTRYARSNGSGCRAAEFAADDFSLDGWGT